MRCKRSNCGNMLILMTALTAFLILALTLFVINFVRFTGSYHEQRSATEAAAIGAAKALSRIVIEDQNFGFISLSDYAPTGRATTAGDNYFMPVTGINTLLATVRLDMIVADLLNDEVLRQYAQLDYQHAMQARQALSDKLQAAVKPNGFGYDIDGKKVEPLNDAIAAYKSNQIRLSGLKVRLIPGSMTLTLGCVPGLTTNTQIPYPSQFAQMDQSQQDNLFYKSFINVPYNGKDFVFAATADDVTLVDFRQFTTSIAGLPYLTPSIVRCEADEEFVGNQQPGVTSTRVVHSAACAQPASILDKRPAPGAFMLSFPNGAVGGISNLLDLMTNPKLVKSPADYTSTPLPGDFPPNPLTPDSLPVLVNEKAPYGQILRAAFYSWLRRGGHKVDVQSLENAFKTALSTSNTPHSDIFEFSSDGSVNHRVGACPWDLPTSNKQWCAMTGLSLSSGGQEFDVLTNDYVFQPGRILGGIHGGEPLGDGAPPPNPKTVPPPNTINLNPQFLGAYPVGPAGGAIRPTYTKNGVAVEVRFMSR